MLRPDIHELTQNDLDEVLLSVSHDQGKILSAFFKWLQEKKFIAGTLQYPSQKDPDDGYDKHEKDRAKMPDDKLLAALGAIFYDTIPPDEAQWPGLQKGPQRSAFVCAMSALALASPNRVAAEQTVVANQEIKRYKSDDGKPIHWLDWQGSKDYKDSLNHLFAGMVEPLERAIKYIRQVTEPGRVLARFYQNPNDKLKNLLGDFKPSDYRMKRSRSDLDAPVHMLQLGYLLEFYNEDAVVPVPLGTKNANRRKNKTYHEKKISDLMSDDRVIMSTKLCVSLMGCNMKKNHIQSIFPDLNDNSLTVSALQSNWIAHIHTSMPTFPRVYASGDNWINGSDALFIFHGSSFLSTKAAYGGQSSFYGLCVGSTLSTMFSNKVSGSSDLKTIFQDFGFSSDFRLLPHQFRHWINDTGERAGISHALLNLWSGRASPEQILAYVHSTEGERASVVRDILFKDFDATQEPEELAKPIKVYSMEEYESLSGMYDGVASVTSTGFCDQNLMTSPCEYLNDFESQCTLCEHSCHVKGDNNSVDFLKKDHTVQVHRLEEVQSKPKFANSVHMQAWYKTHHPNVAMLEQLIELLQDDSIEKGSVIRVLPSRSEIRITDLSKKTVTKRKLALPSTDKDLERCLEDLKESESDSDSRFTQLLALF